MSLIRGKREETGSKGQLYGPVLVCSIISGHFGLHTEPDVCRWTMMQYHHVFTKDAQFKTQFKMYSNRTFFLFIPMMSMLDFQDNHSSHLCHMIRLSSMLKTIVLLNIYSTHFQPFLTV